MLPLRPDQTRPPTSLSDTHLSATSLSDTHTIETPEQIPIEFAVAGIGSRFLALLIDTLIQTGVGIALLLTVGVAFRVAASIRNTPGFSQAGGVLLILSAFLLFFGYFAIFEIVWNGQTPGKRIIGLRVVKDSGRPLTAAESIGRNLMRIVDSLPSFYAVGIIAAVCNSQNKRLGDFVAGSIVVRERSLQEMKPDLQNSQAQSNAEAFFPPPPLGAQGLSMEELTLIDTFLHRRHSLEMVVRARMAHEVFDRVKHQLSLPPGDVSVESILEMAAYQRRSTGSFS
jgi:uncharacterized RDD family membrane protein YckC